MGAHNAYGFTERLFELFYLKYVCQYYNTIMQWGGGHDNFFISLRIV